MKASLLNFERPTHLDARQPLEFQGLSRSEVRLLVSRGDQIEHTSFPSLTDYLEPGDLLVVNDSATIPASLEALAAAFGTFTLNLSTHYGRGLWVAEPRWSHAQPGPLPIVPGDSFQVADIRARLIAPFPQIPRLWFVQFPRSAGESIYRHGRPIRYGYANQAFPIQAYQTIFSRNPGSAEMPSAGRPFNRRLVQRLQENGIEIRAITLHTGVSSLEVESQDLGDHPLYPEPYQVLSKTARAINQTRQSGGRVIAVGTTVVRALQSAWTDQEVAPSTGFTNIFIQPEGKLAAIDGLLTGLHDSMTSHLAILYSLAGRDRILRSYKEAITRGYRWHEFGDSHLIIPSIN